MFFFALLPMIPDTNPVHRIFIEALKFRSQIVEEKFGEGTSDPAIFGQLMIDSGVNSEEIREKLFKNIRLLPSRAKFRKQIEKWAASALEEIAD